MTLDDIKGRTYTSAADFWRDLERLVGRLESERLELKGMVVKYEALLTEAEARAKVQWDEKEALAFDRDQCREERDELAEKLAALIHAIDTWGAQWQDYVFTAGCAEALDAIVDKYRSDT